MWCSNCNTCGFVFVLLYLPCPVILRVAFLFWRVLTSPLHCPYVISGNYLHLAARMIIYNYNNNNRLKLKQPTKAWQLGTRCPGPGAVHAVAWPPLVSLGSWLGAGAKAEPPHLWLICARDLARRGNTQASFLPLISLPFY